MSTLEHRILQPSERKYEHPLLLLHGAWHGAWCWENAMHDFAQRGIEVHAMSFRAHGSSGYVGSINRWGIKHYLDDVDSIIETITPKPILVGHSMGGYIAQMYVSQKDLPGAVLVASIPVTGSLAFIKRLVKAYPFAALKALATMNLGYLISQKSARELLFRPTIEPAKLKEYTTQLQSESVRLAVEASLTKPKYAKVKTPMLVIAAENDHVFKISEQCVTANVYNVPLHIIPQASHDLMLDPAWPQAADLIEKFVADR